MRGGAWRAERPWHFGDGIDRVRAKLFGEALLELAIGVDIHGIVRARHRSDCILAKIEASDGRRFFCAPVADALVSFFAFVDFCAGGREAQLARPMEGHVVVGKLRVVAKVRIPAFTGAYEEHAIAGVPNYVAVIAKGDFEFLSLLWSPWEHCI